MQNKHDFDITKNIKLIEWLKSELIGSVADIYKLLLNSTKKGIEALTDVLAEIIMICYLLGRRLGIQYSDIDQKIHEKSKLGIIEQHDIEKEFGDLSSLNSYIKNNRE